MSTEDLAGKIVDTVYVHSNEVDITFTDGTRLYIELELIPDRSYYGSPYQDCRCIPYTIQATPYLVVDKEYHSLDL